MLLLQYNSTSNGKAYIITFQIEFIVLLLLIYIYSYYCDKKSNEKQKKLLNCTKQSEYWAARTVK